MIFQFRVRRTDDGVRFSTRLKHEDSMNTVTADCCRINYAGDPVQYAFDVLGKDIKAFGRNDHFLLTPADGKVSILVDRAHVAGMEPPVLKRARGVRISV